MSQHALTLLTLTPLAGALVVLALGADKKVWARWAAIGFSLLALLQAALIWHGFDPAVTELQFVEKHQWIKGLGVDYFVGVDGLGLLMILLTALVVTFGLFASPADPPPSKGYYALFLLLQAGLFGTFTALNFFHWFLYWELGLVPAFFLIKMWGGPDRGHAATQFFIYTMVGSVAMLLAFQAIFLATGTFDFIELARQGRSGELASALTAKITWLAVPKHLIVPLIFLGVFLGFAVKVPLVPFHTWLPSAYAEAPGSTTMVLTGVMSKMGVYGFLRVLLPLFPGQTRQLLTPLLVLAVVTIVCSAYAALAQKDLKRMLAYSSVNHLGYCMLGLFAVMKLGGSQLAMTEEKAAALNGVLLQMFNHGLTASAMFCFVGFLERRSGGLRGLDDFGGLRKILPVFCGLMGIALFSSLGLPGLNGFVSEFLIFKGAFALTMCPTIVAALGLLLTALFLLNILQKVFSGPLNEKWAGMPDLTLAERWTVAPAIALMFIIGLYPAIVLKVTNPTVKLMVTQIFN